MSRNTQGIRQWLLLRRLEASAGATLEELLQFVPEDYPKHSRTIRREMSCWDGFQVLAARLGSCRGTLHVLGFLKTLKGWIGMRIDRGGAEEAERQDFTRGSPMRRCGWPKRKINNSPVRWPVSSNSVGSLTIMKTGGGQGGENFKKAEPILVFYDSAAYSDSHGKNNR